MLLLLLEGLSSDCGFRVQGAGLPPCQLEESQEVCSSDRPSPLMLVLEGLSRDRGCGVEG